MAVNVAMDVAMYYIQIVATYVCIITWYNKNSKPNITVNNN